MRFLFPLAAVLTLLASAAHADTMYTLSGTFASGAVLSGTVTGLPNGQPVTLTATVTTGSSSQIFDVTAGTGATVDTFLLGLTSPASEATEELYLYLPQRTLFAGEALCSTTMPCGGGADFTKIVSRSSFAVVDSLVSGGAFGSSSLSGGVNGGPAVTPEPASFALIGTGLLGLAGVVKRRLV